jgi:hypothetical protein
MYDLNDLAAKHDARILAAACMSKTAYLYQQLRMLGLETPDTLQKIFQFGMDRTLEDGEKARVQTDQHFIVDPNKKAN